jgi:2-keto-4-pentenoate hydratase/2-oxohepta-3-ene-1,7-dioic acid hydratase in catechol pathway
MRICRYNADCLGLVKGDQLIDVTIALECIPERRWPHPPGDQMIAHLAPIMDEIENHRKMGYVQGVNNVTLKSPIANPTKVIGAPANYRDHVAEAAADNAINFGREIKTIEEYGLFLKNSHLVGAGEGIVLGHTDRRNDHEVEIAMIIGKPAKNVGYDEALDYLAGYSIGLDTTVRGVEDRSLRKALDSYSLLGPWMTTADEIENPDDLNFRIKVNGETRQDSNTKHLIFDCRKLIEYASKFYTLYPGDVIMTGTPQGVGPLEPGDTLVCEADIIGRMEVEVR